MVARVIARVIARRGEWFAPPPLEVVEQRCPWCPLGWDEGLVPLEGKEIAPGPEIRLRRLLLVGGLQRQVVEFCCARNFGTGR